MKFHKLLREKRVDYGLTQNELGNLINKSTSYICDLEHNRKNPSLNTLVTISKVLNLDLNLITEEER